MPASTHDRKFYLRAPGLEFRVNGPIKIGNVITDMTYPQDPITRWDPLSKIVSGSGFSKGTTETKQHASINAGLATKLWKIFGGQTDAKRSESMTTVYAFDKISALYLEKNPTVADARAFRTKDENFKNALRDGPVYIVTGLKIARGLRYSNQRASGNKASLKAEGHVTQDVTLEGHLEGEKGTENIDDWTVLGDLIFAYRLHAIKSHWSFRGEGGLTSKSHDPGDAGFMNIEDEKDGFEGEMVTVLPDDIDGYAEQHFWKLNYVDVEDDEEEWTLAILE